MGRVEEKDETCTYHGEGDRVREEGGGVELLVSTVTRSKLCTKYVGNNLSKKVAGPKHALAIINFGKAKWLVQTVSFIRGFNVVSKLRLGSKTYFGRVRTGLY